MQIKKFKLINDGYDGLKITAVEAVKLDNKATVLDDVDRTRKIPVPLALKGKIAGLTYFFLNLTRHWALPFNNYFNLETYDLLPINQDEEMHGGEKALRNLWNDTTITGASIDASGGFIIMGKINVFGDKVIGIATPTVTPEDDLGFYAEAKERLDEIADDIIELINIQALPEYSKEQLELAFGIDADELNTAEITEKVMENLAERGALIIMDAQPAIEGKKKKEEGSAELKADTGSIDGDNHEVAEEAPPEPEPEPEPMDETPPVKEAGDKSTLASEGDISYPDDTDQSERGKDVPPSADGPTMDNLEHSENMGGTAGVEEDEEFPDDDPDGESNLEDESWPE